MAVNQLEQDGVYGAGLYGRLQRLVRLLLPPRCLLCAEPGQASLDLCPACLAALPLPGPACTRCALPLPAPGTCGACQQRPPPLDSAHACLRYAPPADRLLPRFKFHQDLAAGRLLVQLMARQRPPLPADAILVPVPLHRSRLRQRGYDQALELARPLARHLGLELRPDLLLRVRGTGAQSGLDAAARRRNLRHAFSARVPDPVPARVVLLDDVMTTGATLYAAARALRQAGVGEVHAWVCARTA